MNSTAELTLSRDCVPVAAEEAEATPATDEPAHDEEFTAEFMEALDKSRYDL